jgi:Photosynthetic reaction centre cytochrome C subunit
MRVRIAKGIIEGIAARRLLLAMVVALFMACDGAENAIDESVFEEEPGIPRLPSEFTNLEVLPRDITKDELKTYMKLVTKSLGTKCDHCHRTDIRDYASDEIKEKRIAREMMRMVTEINREHFSWPDAPQASCFMCHHGELEPQLEPGVSIPARPIEGP